MDAKPGRKTLVRGVLVTLGVLLVLIAVAIASMDRWLFVLLDPGPFDPAATPPAPD